MMIQKWEIQTLANLDRIQNALEKIQEQDWTKENIFKVLDGLSKQKQSKQDILLQAKKIYKLL